jgi:MFS family permease
MKERRKGWAVTAVVFFASIAIAANRFKVPPVMQVLMDSLQVDMVTGGWLMSISSVAGIVLAIPAALLMARRGPRNTGLFALGCTVGGAVAGALATNATVLLVGRVIEGISVGLIAVLAPAVISLWFEPQERGLPMGVWAAWVPVGNVLAFNTAHPLQAALGWRGVWWSGALIALVAFALFGLMVDTPPRSAPRKSNSSEHPDSFARMLPNRASWLLGLAFGAFAFCLLGYNTWAPSFLAQELGISASSASFYASLMFVAAIPANVIAGWMVDLTEKRHHLLVTAFVLTGLIFAWSFHLRSISAVAPYMLALGFASNFIPTLVFTLAPETMPSVEYAGLALAIVMIGSNLGSLAGPPALGAILSHDQWTAGSTFFVIVMSLGTIAALLVGRRATTL